MLLIAYGVCVLAMLAGLGFVLLGAWLMIRGGRKTLCPGPRRRWWEWAWVMGWFYRAPCGYNLRCQIPDDQDRVRCPECGAKTTRMWMRRNTVRVKPMVTGCALMASGWLGMRSEWLEMGKISVQLPTRTLIVVQEVLGESAPAAVRVELDSRMAKTLLNEWETEHAVKMLVEELRTVGEKDREQVIQMLGMLGGDAPAVLEEALSSSDARQRRQVAAVLMGVYSYRPSEQMLRVCVEGLNEEGIGSRDRWQVAEYLIEEGEAATGVLEEALRSSSLEQRQMAASVLTRIGTYRPSEQMLRVCVEELRSGSVQESANYLAAHVEQAEAMLLEGMRNGDEKQRLLCAAIFGRSGWVKRVEEAAPVLIEHLKDNDIKADATVAESGLLGFGWAVREMLKEAMGRSNDQQQTAKLYAILSWLNGKETDPVISRTIGGELPVPGADRVDFGRGKRR